MSIGGPGSTAVTDGVQLWRMTLAEQRATGLTDDQIMKLILTARAAGALPPLAPATPADPPPAAQYTPFATPWLNVDQQGNLFCYGNLVSPGVGLLYQPSGDSTGATDGAAIAALFAAGAKLVQLTGGTYYTTANQIVLDANKQQFLAGAGDTATIIQLVGASAGVGVTLKNTAGAYNGNTQRCGLRFLRVDGSNAAAGSDCIQAGDSGQISLINISATAAPRYNLRIVNIAYFTEQLTGIVYTAGAGTANVVFDIAGGTASFDRMDLTIYMSGQPVGCNGVGIIGTNAVLQGGRMQIYGNSSGAVSPNYLLGLTNGAVMQNFNLNIGVENDIAGTGPICIFLATSASNIAACYGSLNFVNAPGNYAAAQLNGGRFWFNGFTTSGLGIPAMDAILSSSTQAIATGNTIAIDGTGQIIRVTLAAAATGVIMTLGSAAQDGRRVTIVNESASNSLTFAASGTSHVADGASDVIAANTAATYVYDNNTFLWYRTV